MLGKWNTSSCIYFYVLYADPGAAGKRVIGKWNRRENSEWWRNNTHVLNMYYHASCGIISHVIVLPQAFSKYGRLTFSLNHVQGNWSPSVRGSCLRRKSFLVHSSTPRKHRFFLYDILQVYWFFKQKELEEAGLHRVIISDEEAELMHIWPCADSIA